ncbi:MAG TPA: RNA polymerase sigma factor [Vicinamibacterales bacterium]|nr:RNA polymerase sigma factor [Vicinamibacterales bacterium]
MENEETLRALMVAYQGGDLEAFDRLYAALEPELRGFLRARCHDPHRVDDLVQETFLQLHRSRRGYLPGLPVRPWAYAIAKRAFLMHVRKVRRRESHEQTELSSAPEPDVPAEADRLTDRSALVSALGQVPADGRRAFLLHHWRGLSFREIAARLGIAPGAAKLRSSRAGSRLRHLLRDMRRKIQ